jgi:hypothetical protein
VFTQERKQFSICAFCKTISIIFLRDTEKRRALPGRFTVNFAFFAGLGLSSDGKSSMSRTSEAAMIAGCAAKGNSCRSGAGQTE